MRGSSKKVMQPKAQLKGLGTKACSIGNKQEELETMVQFRNYSFTAIMET